MNGLLELWSKSPARIVGAVQAVLLLLVAFGVPITEDQTAKIIAAIAAIVFALGGAEIVRSQVFSANTVKEIATAPPTAAGPIAAAEAAGVDTGVTPPAPTRFRGG